jgi:hypothetical protein
MKSIFQWFVSRFSKNSPTDLAESDKPKTVIITNLPMAKTPVFQPPEEIQTEDVGLSLEEDDHAIVPIIWAVEPPLEPIEEELIEESMEDPVIEEPVEDSPLEPVIEESVIEESVVEESVVKESVIEESVIEDSVIEEPVEDSVLEPIEEETVESKEDIQIKIIEDGEIMDSAVVQKTILQVITTPPIMISNPTTDEIHRPIPRTRNRNKQH